MLASIPTELTLIYAMLYDTALTRQPSYILCDTARILRFLLTVLLLLLLPTLLQLLLLSLLCAMMLDWCACGTEQKVSIGCGTIPVRFCGAGNGQLGLMWLWHKVVGYSSTLEARWGVAA